MSNLGMAQRMLEISLKRANDRVTFGKPIASRQIIKAKIADMQMMVHVLPHRHLRLLARDFDIDPRDHDNAPEKAAIRKLFSIQTVEGSFPTRCWRFSAATATSRIPRTARPSVSYRDCRAMSLEEGAPCVQRITIARETQNHGGVIKYNF